MHGDDQQLAEFRQQLEDQLRTVTLRLASHEGKIGELWLELYKVREHLERLSPHTQGGG